MNQPTMQQVAERAGVSTALVSLVMRGAPNVSDKRRALVLEAADELGYRPNVLARNLASRRTRTLGVVINDLHNPFFAEMVDGIQTTAAANDYRILIGNGQHSRRGESDAIETFLQFRVDGLILAGPVVTEGEMETAAKSAAVVAIGRTASSLDIDTVNCDDAVGARLVVEHLAGLGHRRISHIDGGSGAGAATRRKGYEARSANSGSATTSRLREATSASRGIQRRRRASRPRPATDSDLRRQRPQLRWCARPRGGRRLPCSVGDVHRGLRQHRTGGDASLVADHDQPAARRTSGESRRS